MEYERTTFLPSNKKENVRNCPGLAASGRFSASVNRNVLASDVCCVIRTSFNISVCWLEGRAGEMFPVIATVPSEGTGILPGRRTINTVTPRQLAKIKIGVLKWK